MADENVTASENTNETTEQATTPAVKASKPAVPSPASMKPHAPSPAAFAKKAPQHTAPAAASTGFSDADVKTAEAFGRVADDGTVFVKDGEGEREVGQFPDASKEEALAKIATLTGGRSAEELIFGSITTGASNDIEQATKLARAMITRYGMSRKFDMVALETVTNQYLSGDTTLACSAETAAQIDEEVIATVKAAHEKAIKILQDNMDVLHRLAHHLLEKETITGDEFMEILERKELPEAEPQA